MLRLSEELICQDVCHRPFDTDLIQFLAALGINPDTLRLCTAPEYSSLLGSLVYCVRVLNTEASSPLSSAANSVAEQKADLSLP
jgi:hypothetical protein